MIFGSLISIAAKLWVSNTSGVQSVQSGKSRRYDRGVLYEHIAICDLSIRRSLIVSIASILEVRLLQCIGLRFQESSKFAPPIISFAATSKALSERYGALIEQELHILRLLASIFVRAGVSALCVATTLQRFRAVDEADVENTSEWLHV